MTRQEFKNETEMLFDEIESLIREKMRQEFDQSYSITPGLQKLIDEEYVPLFDRIHAFRRELDKQLIWRRQRKAATSASIALDQAHQEPS